MPNTTSEKFDFTNSNGQKLSGRLELPEHPVAYAIFAHCFTCSKNVKAASRISRSLSAQGVGVLRFDFTGLGNSEGDFSNTNYSSNLSDIEAAAKALAGQFQAPSLLIGHSLGGTACLDAASRLDSVKAVCTIGSPAQPVHVTRLFGESLKEIENKGAVEVQLGGRPFTIQKHFVDDVRSASLEERIKTLGKATLIFHSPQDQQVNIDQARLIYQSLQHPKSFISLEGADHLLTDEADAGYVADSIVAWVQRYLAAPVASSSSSTLANDSSSTRSVPLDASQAEMAHGEVWVRQNRNFTHDVITHDHVIVADEPTSIGGANLGMTPYDLLLAALGTCTSMTLKIYADHKKLPLEHVEVKLAHSKIHSTDCEKCESDTGKVDSIEKQIFVKGDLTPEQVTRLGEIADRCPVNRTLLGEKQISTSITLTG